MGSLLRSLVLLALGLAGTWAVAGCADLKHGTPAPPGEPPPEPAAEQAGEPEEQEEPPVRERRPPDEPDDPPTDDEKPGAITVEALLAGRGRLGAHPPAGFWPWRSGLAVHDGWLYWVENGTEPGLYSAPVTCRTAACVTKLAKLTRPVSFTATDTAIYTADTTVLKRLAFAPGSELETVASATKDIVNIAVNGNDVFWTAGHESAIRWTNGGGTTSTPIYSNGTPVAIAVAGSKVFWAGVDISGQVGALQSMSTSGTGAREVARFSDGFQVMRGNGTYLYYATGRPSEIHRLTLATGRDEVVVDDALGVSEIALDATHAYWAEPGDRPDYKNGQVRRVAHASKTPETLAVSIKLPVAIALAPKRVYVASAGSNEAFWNDGKILEITLP